MDRFEVGRGEGKEFESLAVFADKEEAIRFADCWNLDNLTEAAIVGPAHIVGLLPARGRDNRSAKIEMAGARP